MPNFTLLESCFTSWATDAAGAITASTNVFADTTFNGFFAGMVGYYVSATGAGAAAANLDTTVATFTSSSTIHLTANASSTTTTSNIAFGNNPVDITSTTVLKVTYNSAIQIGDVLVVDVNIDPTTTITGVTDSAGNTYSIGVPAGTNADYYQVGYDWIATNASSAGANSFSITFSKAITSQAGAPVVAHAAYRAPAGYGSVTFVGGHLGNSTGTSVATGTVTTSSAITLYHAYTGVDSHVTAGPGGWTTAANDPNGDTFAYITQQGSGTIGATFTQASAAIYLAGVMAFGASPGIPNSWTTEPPPQRRRSFAIQQGDEIIKALSAASLLNFGSWTTDPPPQYRLRPGPQSVDPLDATAPPAITGVRYQDTTLPPAQRRTQPQLASTEALDVATAVVSLATWQRWSEDTPSRQTRAWGLIESPSASGFTLPAMHEWSFGPGALQWRRSPTIPETPFVGASIGWAPTSWLRWTDDLAPQWRSRSRAEGDFVESELGGGFESRWLAGADGPISRSSVRRTADTPFVGSTLGWAPTSFVQWTLDPLSRPVTHVLPDTPFLGASGAGAILSEWLAWTVGEAGATTRIRTFSETPYVGTSLGWAPSSWVPWTTDPPARARAVAPALGDAPLDTVAFLQIGEFAAWTTDGPPRRIPTLGAQSIDPVFDATVPPVVANFPAWTTDPIHRQPIPPRPETQQPVGTALGVFVGEYQTWTTDPTRRYVPPGPTVIPFLGGSLALFTPASLAKWSDDPVPYRATARAPQESFLGAPLAFIGAFFGWTTDAPPTWRQARVAPQTDAPFTATQGSTSSWLPWASEPVAAQRRVVQQPGFDAWPFSTLSPALLNFAQWTTDPPRAWRPNPTQTDVPFLSSSLQSFVPASLARWSDDPRYRWQRGPVSDTPYVGSTTGFAPTSWVPWSPDPIPYRRPVPSPQSVEALDATVPPAIGKFLEWSTPPKFLTWQTRPFAPSALTFGGVVFVLGPLCVDITSEPILVIDITSTICPECC